MTVAFWQVITHDLVADDPMLLAAVNQWAEGELRLAASREDSDIVGIPRRTELALYWIDTAEVGENGRPVRRLEPAAMLRMLGLPVPDQPSSVLVRWEQETRRNVWARPPAIRLPRSGWGR